MATKKDFNYQTLNNELEQLLSELQSGISDVEASLVKYERGLEIVAELREYLKTAQNKVTKLK